MKPDDPAVLRDLAWVLVAQKDASIYDPAEAIQLAERVCELTDRRDAACLDTLAMAYSEAGRFEEAVEAAEEAIAVALTENGMDLAAEIEERLVFYRKGRPYHDIREQPSGRGQEQ